MTEEQIDELYTLIHDAMSDAMDNGISVDVFGALDRIFSELRWLRSELQEARPGSGEAWERWRDSR